MTVQFGGIILAITTSQKTSNPTRTFHRLKAPHDEVAYLNEGIIIFGPETARAAHSSEPRRFLDR
jgi:hypothetical protein